MIGEQKKRHFTDINPHFLCSKVILVPFCVASPKRTRNEGLSSTTPQMLLAAAPPLKDLTNTISLTSPEGLIPHTLVPGTQATFPEDLYSDSEDDEGLKKSSYPQKISLILIGLLMK
jgi:hypothetical protein